MALTKVSRGLLSTSIVDNGNATAITIDANENVLVGKTAVDTNTAGFEARSTGFIGVTRADVGAYFTRLSTDGEIIQFRKGSAPVGSIGTSSADGFYIHSTFGNDSGLVFGSERIVPCTSSGAFEDGVQDLGYSSGRFKDLYLSGGVVFGSTGGAVTSKTLDDYEEGTWTGTLTGSTTAPSTAQTATGTYTKVGNLVTVNIGFSNKDTTGASGNAQITGLPFTCGDNVQGAGWNSRIGSGTDVKMAYIGSDNNIVWINGHGTSLAWTTTGTGTYAGVTITFMVA